MATMSYNSWDMCSVGHCYMLRDDGEINGIQESSWQEAQQFCQAHDANLLSINSDGELHIIIDWLMTKQTQNYIRKVG